ncbi:hypothetical protein RCK10_25030, partial [Salmonella enterica subsp. enterica serovar 1,4,[5],12:i:-]
NTTLLHHIIIIVTDYQRWLGVEFLWALLIFDRGGLSPLARGTLPFTNNNRDRKSVVEGQWGGS